MSLFVVGVAALLVVAALLIVLGARTRLRPADADDPNLNWLRQRRVELADSDDPALLEELGLRALEEQPAAAADDPPLARSAPAAATAGSRRLALLMLVALAVFSGPLYLRLGALEDVRIYRQLENLPGESPAALAALTDAVRKRSGQRPENLYYLELLGQLQLTAEDLPAAAQSFLRLAEAAPESARAQAQAAQYLFVAAGRRLSENAQLLAERALALDPQEATALGLLGMASFESGQYSAAVQYWERLQALETPDSEGYRMLGDVIALARERGGSVPPVVDSDEQQAGITVSLSLPEGLQVEPSAAVFVFARPPAAESPMPVAARRLSAAELPLTLRLSDADSMAGQRLSEVGTVVVSVQLSKNGQPGRGNAALRGDSGPVTPSLDAAPVHIELMPVEAP